MVFFCFIHLMAAEFVSPQRPKGDVLIFRRSRNLSKARNKDVEEKPAFTGSANSKDLKYVEGSDHIYDVPLGIEKHTSILTWYGLSYDIKIKNKARRLLDQVDGWVKPGSPTALMVGLNDGDLRPCYNSF
jgi:ATP-binding cassette, subfamily G (WHITE), member 2, PDR